MASEVSEFNSAVDTLLNMFGGVINKDVIITVVESCGGDLNLSVDAIMKITNDGDAIKDMLCYDNKPIIEPVKEITANSSPVNQNAAPINKLPSSFANIASQQPTAPFQKYGAVPKGQKISPIKIEWNDQIRRIIENHNKGSCILILMRGAPGSGKTHLAKNIIEMVVGGTYINFRTHILSTDDFFMMRGKYCFNKNNLSIAHNWNQNRASLGMSQGLSPVIIDNTNIEVWQMEPYVRSAVQNGYMIELIESNTSWAKNPNQLARKNIHNVPLTTIKRMIDNYEHNITADYLLKYFNLTYPLDRVPPVLRSIPDFQYIDSNVPSTLVETKQMLNNLVPENMKTSSEEAYTDNNFSILSTPQNIQQDVKVTMVELEPASTAVEHPNLIEYFAQSSSAKFSPEPNHSIESEVNYDIKIIEEAHSTLECVSQHIETNVNFSNDYLEVQKKLEEIEKVEQEWDNGENWEEIPQTSSIIVDKDNIVNGPKPPRSQSNNNDNFIDIVDKVQDWQQISMFMPPWPNETTPTYTVATPKILVETTTSGTSMEFGDFDRSKNNFKVLASSYRDINEFYVPTVKEKIPDKRMLDKSTWTNEQWLTEANGRCLHHEKHFSIFKKFFKHSNKTALRDIFDRCEGDVNWAVEIVLDSGAAIQTNTDDEEETDDEDDDDVSEMCRCLSAYQIVPDTSSSQHKKVATQKDDKVVSERTAVPKKASKREVALSDASVELKRQIEQNVMIADSHYSEHCLKIRRFRHGYPENIPDESQPSTSQDPPCGYQDADGGVSSDEEESSTSVEEVEKSVNFTLGSEFIVELDKLFGRTDMSYPDTVVPKINISVSLLNEINALWMESLMHQLDEQERQRAKIIQEDEDFARALALKEAELAESGKEPEVLSFKEIMDMELALSLYQRDVAKWRNKEPNDLAAKLTREKLYNLFPDVQKDVLAELLMAHDNNFQQTVEVLLVSTEKSNILMEKDGVNKFVMKMEMQRQEKILREERKALSEEEWPLLPKGEVPDMAVVNNYRAEADGHLHSRNVTYQKSIEYLNRGMTLVASYYRQLSSIHKLKYEQSNSLAAASLIQLHASKCSSLTIDLHFLRVNEAIEALDLFLDTHVQKLKQNQRGSRHYTVYIITGRGLHSNGRPRIKPAVQRRLGERRLVPFEVNPGLLSARICADDLLSDQLA